jgi:hypothetical protein
MARRVAALDDAMAARDVEHAVLRGANRVGSAIGWLTRWPVTREAVVVYTPGERIVLLVNGHKRRLLVNGRIAYCCNHAN